MICKLKRVVCKVIFLEGLKGRFKRIPDEIYLKVVHYTILNKMVNLHNISTYNEKLQWIKLYDHSPNIL